MDKEQLYDALASRKISDRDKGSYTFHNDRVNRCIKSFQDGTLKTGGSLLDVGGNVGDLCLALKDKFESTKVIDISVDNVRICLSRGIPASCCDIDKLGLPTKDDSTVDTVTALDLIEHIMDP